MKDDPRVASPWEELSAKLKWLMFLRCVVITFLLGVTLLIQFKGSEAISHPLYLLIGFVYLLTIFYAFLLKKMGNLKFFAHLQILLDVLFITALIYVTGGSESLFSFLYILSIITASMILYRRGGILTASLSSILYGAAIDLEYHGIIHPISSKIFPAPDFNPLYTILMNIIAFYIVAFLSSLLSEETRKSKEELMGVKIDLDKLEAINKNIVQNLTSGILTINPQDEITSFNRAAEEITGYSLYQVYNSRIGEFFPNLELDGQPSRFETTFKRPDGTPLHLGFSTSPLRDKEGKELGKILIFQDLTKVKEMEEEIKRMDRLAAAGKLAAGIAHEIRNPLASMSGAIQVLKRGLKLSSEDKRLMEIVLRETERLDRLISNFLLYALPTSKKKEITSLHHVIYDTLRLIFNSPEWKGNTEILRHLEEDILLEADPSQLKQLFWNLFLNAAQAMPLGGRLSVSTHLLSPQEIKKDPEISFFDSNSFVKITVSDTGSGIPLEYLDNIFDPFFTTKENGTGLGLSISHRIVEGLKGRIKVRSKEGEGTEFVIYLLLDMPSIKEENR